MQLLNRYSKSKIVLRLIIFSFTKLIYLTNAANVLNIKYMSPKKERVFTYST
jgi:hypothetical protein